MTSVALEHLASMLEAKNAERAMREAMQKAAAAAAKAAGGGQGQQGAQGADGAQGQQGAQGATGTQPARQQQVQQLSPSEMSEQFKNNGAAGQQWNGFRDNRSTDPAAQAQQQNGGFDPGQLYSQLAQLGQQGTARPIDPADAAAANTANPNATRTGQQGTRPTTQSPATQPSADANRGTGTKRQFRGYQETDVNKLRDQLPANAKHLAQQFIDSGKKHNIDPLALAAIAKHETGNFTSSAFKNKNNAMGISNKKGPVRMSSAEASIEKMAKGLADPKGYYKKANTIGQVGQIYAPIGAANDPRGLNGAWPRGVGRNFDDLVRAVRS